MYIISATDFAPILLENALFSRQNARRPQKSLILLEILPAEFIQAYPAKKISRKTR